MKRINIAVYLVMVLSFLMMSCERENLFHESEMVEEGLPAEISLNFKSKENNIVSRAERDPKDENRVNNVYLFVFNSEGNVHERIFCTPNSGLSYDGENTDKGQLHITTRSLNGARIVGVANVNEEGVTSTVFNVTKEMLDAIDTYDQLQSMVMIMSENSIERYSTFMMTGFAKVINEDGTENEIINIPSTASVNNPFKCNIALVRADAKIKFDLSVEPENPEWVDFSFSPKTWTVKNVPSQSYLLERSDKDYDDENTAKYFSSLERPFEIIERSGKLDIGGSFVFYMPENRKEPQKEVTDYAQRDAWNVQEGIDEDGNRIFTNANNNSTYVEITGLLSYNSEGKNTNADVRFIVHLGNTNEKSGGSVNNYSTNRNTFYTYYIKIKGVENIKVEVNSDDVSNDVRPGFEGDVVNTEKQAFVFDSHYDRCLITINPADFAENGRVYWSVNTPFSRGVYEIPTDVNAEVPKELRDYRWIKFAVNKEYGVANNQFVKYPGDQNYNDPYPMDDWIKGEDYDAASTYYNNYETARLMDINQFMAYIREQHNNNVDENLTVSVFVDENLYFKDPIENTEGANKTSLWKLTSDKQDRIMYLVIEQPKYSEDKQSSVAVAEYSFRQRTIRTIFNVDKPELETAWGLESVMETERLEPGNVSKGTDTRNGRANCLKWLVNKKWTDIVNVSGEQYELKSGYNNAAYACLLRNRDLNGDNVIDSNEIRWYLASIDQLTDIFLGEYALDEQSRLYPSNSVDREEMLRWHYTSSSYNSSDENAWVLWAEEGASRGTFDKSSDYMDGRYSYRCVRNLGLSLENPDALPDDLVSVTNEGNGYYLIDLTNMNIKARRTSIETVTLPPHDERSDINRPYAKFRVHPDAIGGDGQTPHVESGNGGEWNDWPWIHYQTFDLGRRGYRIPNQRELLIMTTRMPSNAWNEFHDGNYSKKPAYICQTAFSLNGHEPEYNNLREGFLWDSSNGVFYLQNDKGNEGYVRPIQDVN